MEKNITNVPVTENQKVEQVQIKKKRNFMYPILIILVLLAGGGAYLWRDNQANKQQGTDSKTISDLQKEKNELEKQLTDAKKSTTLSNTTNTTTTSCTSTLPTASTKENVIASITSGNTAALESYMAPSVRVVIAASEAAFERTPTKAVEDIKYIQSAQAPWNFALPPATLASYKAGFYKDYFKDNSVVGVSKDKEVIVFNFNCTGNGKIDSVFMAASSDLLTE
jgi:cytoskeletal protein RodZ